MWLFILNKKQQSKFVKQTRNFIKIILLFAILLFLCIFLKYKPAYAVIYNNKIIGYAENKEELQQRIDNDILKSEDEAVAFVVLDNVDYSFQFASRELINDDEILSELKSNSKNYYQVFEVTDEDDESEENSVFFNSIEDANEYVDSIKNTYSKIETKLAITTLYVENEVTDEAIQLAKAKVTEKLDAELQEKEEQERIESQTVNGIYLACLPVTDYTITSRYGADESIRDHTHKGLDLAADYGEDIHAAADGIIKVADWWDGYGNLIIIDHGNGIETYYGHCSKLYVSEGQTVKAGDVVAAVGSTGDSTGNHCHFEIRIDGTQVNPQNYLYN